MLDYYRVHWVKFREYPKLNKLKIRGGAYGLVFNDTQPKDYELPWEFEECIYIGKSYGNYIDKKSNTNSKYSNYVYKRMTNHNTNLMNKKSNSDGWQEVFRQYGYGETMVNGTMTGRPLWIGVVLPRPDMPELYMPAWALMMEKSGIYGFLNKFGYTQYANMETEVKRKEGSFSSEKLKQNTLEEVCYE